MSAVVNVATPSRTVRNHGRALIDSHAPDGSVHGSRDNFHHPDAPDLIQRPNHNQLQANLEQILGRKAALNALTGAFKQDNRDPSRESHKSQQSLSAPTNKMNQMTPMVRHRSPPYGASAASVGDIVSVGGGMTGTVRFVGKVKGKDDTYAGVELDPEFSTKGKNSGNANGYVPLSALRLHTSSSSMLYLCYGSSSFC